MGRGHKEGKNGKKGKKAKKRQGVGKDDLPSSDPFEAAVLDYGHNLLTGTVFRRADALRWRRLERIDLIERLLQEPQPRRRVKALRAFEAGDPEELQRARFERYLAREGAKPRRPRPPGAPVAANLEIFARLFELDEDAQALLTFFLTLQASEDLAELSDVFREGNLVTHCRTLAAATGRSAERLLAALGPRARLITTGLVCVDEGDNHLRYKISLKAGLSDLAQAPTLDRQQVLERFLCRVEPSTLDWADFREVDESAHLARALLGAALRRQQRGVNVLLYGPTGTGKTELARRLADELGVSLFAAGRADASGHSANPRERLSSLLLGHELLGATPALMLFDELEDLFTADFPALLFDRGARGTRISKQWFNLLLEQNTVPTIWITNSTQGMDPAFLRRFTFAVALRSPGAGQRARILARHLGDDALVSAADTAAIAQRFAVSAAQFGTAVAAARLLVPSDDTAAASLPASVAPTPRVLLERLLEPAEALLGGERQTVMAFDAQAFRVEALCSSEDLAAVGDQLADWQPRPGPGLSLCLYGPSGSGKSEYARYLAHRMGRPIVMRRVSDLQSMWVGQCEQNIAEAFREARAEDALLLFDEADSFLRDRDQARNSWEVTQVNEFLQQLEAHSGVVVCTTNLWHELDPASLRRFVLKVAFDYLDAPRARLLFCSLLGPFCAQPLTAEDEERAERSCARLPALTPGDLATVRRKLQALRARPPLSELLALVEAEVRAKRGIARPVGFEA